MSNHCHKLPKKQLLLFSVAVFVFLVLSLDLIAQEVAQDCYRFSLDGVLLSSVLSPVQPKDDPGKIFFVDFFKQQGEMGGVIGLDVGSPGSSLAPRNCAVNRRPDVSLIERAPILKSSRGYYQVEEGLFFYDHEKGLLEIDSPRRGAFLLPKRIHWLDHALTSRGVTNLQNPLRQSNGKKEADQIFAIYESVIVGDFLFGHGAVGNSANPQSFQVGFFEHELRPPGHGRVAPEANMVRNFGHFEYYMLTKPYIAPANDGRVYFLEMVGGSAPTLQVYEAGSGVQPSTVDGLDWEQKLPIITSQSPDEMLPQLEEKNLPLGIYFQDSDEIDFLYMLSQTYDSGETAWSITKYATDPELNVVRKVGNSRLPIDPKTLDVSILPTHSGEWYAFEKGRIHASEELSGYYQDVFSVVAIPHSLIESPGEFTLAAEDCVASGNNLVQHWP